MNIRKLSLAVAVCGGLTLYLLGGESPDGGGEIGAAPVPATDNAPSPAASSTTEQQDAAPNSEAATETATDTSTETTSETANNATTLAYQPPFPERNPFQAPKRLGKGRLTSDGQKESAIELLGFVNVYGPEVVLSIDGLATTIAEGAQHAGVEVISIKPPSVFLQRGKQTWQATLEN